MRPPDPVRVVASQSRLALRWALASGSRSVLASAFRLAPALATRPLSPWAWVFRPQQQRQATQTAGQQPTAKPAAAAGTALRARGRDENSSPAVFALRPVTRIGLPLTRVRGCPQKLTCRDSRAGRANSRRLQRNGTNEGIPRCGLPAWTPKPEQRCRRGVLPADFRPYSARPAEAPAWDKEDLAKKTKTIP